jgi:hypothetical protein
MVRQVLGFVALPQPTELLEVVIIMPAAVWALDTREQMP